MGASVISKWQFMISSQSVPEQLLAVTGFLWAFMFQERLTSIPSPHGRIESHLSHVVFKNAEEDSPWTVILLLSQLDVTRVLHVGFECMEGLLDACCHCHASHSFSAAVPVDLLVWAWPKLVPPPVGWAGRCMAFCCWLRLTSCS